MKRRFLSMIIVIAVILSMIPMSIPVLAKISLPSISSSTPIYTYTYKSSGKIYRYTDSSLKTKESGHWIDCANDECKIIEIQNDAVKVIYPTSSGPKTGWFVRSEFCKGDLKADQANLSFKSTKKITTYRWKENNTVYGYISKGDKTYLLRGSQNSSWLQVLYPVSGGYKMAWIKGDDSRNVIWPSVTTGISLNSTSVNLTGAGSTFTLKATVTPPDSAQGVSWSSSNSSVATVSNGVVTATGAGSAVITATSGSVSASATVSVVVNTAPVTVNPTRVSLNTSTFTLNGNSAKKQLSATVAPDNATDKSVTWSSSNKKVATVSKNGLVKPVANGSCTITAKTVNGKKASAKVTCKNIKTVLYYPLKGKITRSSTRKTNGQYCDYKASAGTPIYAPANGKVRYRQSIAIKYKKLASYGNSVVFISSDGNYTVLCAHLSKFKDVPLEYKKSLAYPCSSDEYTCTTNTLKTRTVKKGELIGYAGHTGNASAAHVHIEVKYKGKAKNPKKVFKTW